MYLGIEIAYTLSKSLLSPEVWIFLGMGIACLFGWFKQWPRSARVVLVVLLVLYYGFTTRLLAQALITPLETYHGRPPLVPARHDALVILVNAPHQESHVEQLTNVGPHNTDLLLCGLPYVRALSVQKVILTGAGPSADHDTTVVSGGIEAWAVLLGYPMQALIAEGRSVATHERVAAVKALLGSGTRILLVDSAMHLPRSAASFRKAGFEVTPVPCDFTFSSERWEISDLIPQAFYLGASSGAVHEYCGLLVYRLRGFI